MNIKEINGATPSYTLFLAVGIPLVALTIIVPLCSNAIRKYFKNVDQDMKAIIRFLAPLLGSKFGMKLINRGIGIFTTLAWIGFIATFSLFVTKIVRNMFLCALYIVLMWLDAMFVSIRYKSNANISCRLVPMFVSASLTLVLTTLPVFLNSTPLWILVWASMIAFNLTAFGWLIDWLIIWGRALGEHVTKGSRRRSTHDPTEELQ
jgi:hypothetical protein